MAGLLVSLVFFVVPLAVVALCVLYFILARRVASLSKSVDMLNNQLLISSASERLRSLGIDDSGVIASVFGGADAKTER